MVFNQTDTFVQELQEQVRGSLLTADSPTYDQIRRGWNLVIDHHPALILVAHDAQDVMAGVRFARETGLGVAVQSTGHGIQQPADDNLLIITSHMAAVEVDPAARTARVEAGALWKDVLDKATPYGLAPLLGSSPHVGVVGYTLGGGVGWLGRRYGFAADSVRCIELVTADGVLRNTSPTENSDLFWGLRGGGGNFGVVTALEFDLYPVATIYGGNLIYAGALAGDVLHFFRDWTATLPDELTSSMVIVKFPSLPQLPPQLRGKTQVIVRAAYTGDTAKGAAYVQEWLDWRTPEENTFREMPFSEIGSISNDPVNPTAAYGSNAMFDELSDDALAVILRHATNSASPLIAAELRHVGGALARVPAAANAIGNRDAQFYFQIGGPLFGPDAKAASAAYIQQFKADLQPYLHTGVYLNFMSGGEAFNRAKDAYLPTTYERLLVLKAQYDPENTFRFSYQLVSP